MTTRTRKAQAAKPADGLTEGRVREIRQLYATGGVSQAKLAARFGVPQATIVQVVTRETWRDLP